MEAILAQQNNSSEKVKLRKATRNDEEKVVNILCNSFKNDPHIKWMLEKSRNPDKLKSIMTSIFRKTITVGKIFLTTDETATALWKSEKKEKFNFEFIKRNLNFLFKVGVKSVVRILANESFTYKQYPKTEKYFHLYAIGVLPESQGKGYASSLMNPILNEMEKNSRPVYLETANIKNVQIYIKKGFKIYNKWINNGIELYYMRKLNSTTI
ncbi:MAG: GNAT family N-acetyltransferase [Bacteroidetes bacterium]|nr:GNAT family N-acetyltransferase [Bacteroidota bacterium]